MDLNDKTILITGGAGSFGQKFAEIVLAKHNPKSVRIYDNSELAQVQMERKFNDSRLRFLMGDVRDLNRLRRAMSGVDLVVHAAALKHVPLCEYNPIEAVKTNIDGAANVVDAAISNSVKKVINISTDKAVLPTNLYGSTKLVAEKIFVDGNNYVGGRETMFSCARYGNFLGSNGSVIPLFLEQMKNGEITVTDERMTRFWITIEEGINFVIDCVEKMKGGEVFIPKMKSMKIMDLARAMAPDAIIKIIGIRNGERLEETLLTPEEARRTKEFDSFFIIEPEFDFWDGDSHQGGKPLAFGSKYSSENNSNWLTQDEIMEVIRNLRQVS